MFKSKYSTLLTILLVVLIIAIIIVVIVLGIKTYKNYKNEKDAKAFEQATFSDDNIQKDDDDDDDDDDDNNISSSIDVIDEGNNNSGNGNTSSVNLPKVKFYKNYPTIGNISIPKTGASYPILLDTSAKALDIAVGVTYPSSPELNKPGNVVIIGHNYRNGKFFSNNKKLVAGDTIKITDLDGKTLSYTIYEIFETIPTDTAYYTRNTDGKAEISLSTCTDDGNNRLIILARAEE